MRRNCLTRHPSVRPVLVAGALAVATLGVGLPGLAGAAQSQRQSVNESLVAKKTVNCGGETIAFSQGNTVAYGQIHATNVSCAIAKEVVRLGGRHDGTPPKGWSYVGAGVAKGNCAFTWRDAKEIVTGYTPDDAGC